ncbi:MAG: hypothetical protein JNM57_01230 [Cyclobacteriaceae bacterium]|nr:hypothetical protein [Cyclobacteriaceae bacterium]
MRVVFRSFILSAIFLLSVQSVQAQDDEPVKRRGSRIIDDTTKQVYGPNTSTYYFEEDVFFNREILYSIDTAIHNFHRFTYVQQHENFHQDLGNMGTAIRPLYYQSPAFIGVSSGFQAYDLYWDTERVKYYDTKSPYSNMLVDLGGKGRSLTRATFSRNINPRWNFGFTYRALLVDKQIQRSGKGDRNVRSTYYDIYTAYQTKDSTYRLFLNFRRNFHEVAEYGGVKTASTDLSAYFLDNAQPWLTEASSNDFRLNTHLFHQYKVGRALQVYHKFDRYRQQNKFIDDLSREANGKTYFDFIEVDSIQANDDAKFKTVRNEVGIKGNLLKLFYNGYYAIRHYDMSYQYIQEDSLKVKTNGDESYLGGRIALRLDSIGEITGWGEIIQDGNYRIEGEIKSKWFEASVKQLKYAPGFLTQAYRGSHDVWNNGFTDTELSQVNGYLHYFSSWLKVSPGLTLTRLKNYVFFREDKAAIGQKVLPYQSGGNQIMALPEIKLSLTFLKHINLSAQGVYTKMIENSDGAIQLPKLFVNAQLSYANIFFNNNLDMHAGVDVHWKSAYNALGYDVAVQQFYNQNTFQVPDFPIVDVFFNGKIKRARIFVKYHNLIQLFTGSGSFPTPYYPGQRNVIDFGFDWSFYD